MLVREIFIFIIIIILIIELYIHFCVKLEVESSSFTNNELKDVKEIIIVNKTPWDKIKETKDVNYYYINIRKFDEVKYLQWKELIPDIEYDITKKIFKIPSKDEERAISIVNLIISNMKGDIDMDEILKNDLINKSIIKSRKYNVVFIKITNLVIENNSELNSELNSENNKINKELKNIDTFELDKNINNEYSQKNKPEIKSIKPEDYNYDGFNNSHYNLFKKNKLLRNNLTAGAYGGKQYARPFKH